MITDYVLVVSLDRHGNVFSAASKPIEPDAREIFIGGCLPLGIPFDPEFIPVMVEEVRRRIGDRAGQPEELGTVTAEGKTYHVFYVFCNGNMSMSNQFQKRWFVEWNLEYLPEVSAKVWKLIKDKPFAIETRSMPSNESPRIVRERGRHVALERLLMYARHNKGVTIRVVGYRAELVDAAGKVVEHPRPISLEGLPLGPK